MIMWLLYVPFSLFFMALCYLTNWFVVLFCDDNGELHGFWNQWQTWDNSANPSDVTEHHQLPSFLLYDWKRHYEEYEATTSDLAAVGRVRWFTRCIDPNFSLLERIQRYICRVYWLTRNCSYGWSFWTLGITPGVRWIVEQHTEDTIYVHEDYILWWLDGAWKYKSTAPIITLFGWTLRWNTFLGWKIVESAPVDTRGMIANRIAFSLGREGE